MRHTLLPALLLGSLLAAPSVARADGDYFGDGTKKLTFKEAGSRTRTQKLVLASLAGGALVAGAIGGYYLLDARSLSDEISASGMHTLKAWDQSLEDVRLDANRSNTIATVSLSIGGGLALAGLIAYFVTQPESHVGYQDWQTRHDLPIVAPTQDGVVLAQGWRF